MQSIIPRIAIVVIAAMLPLVASAEEPATIPFQFSFFDIDAPEGDAVKGLHLSAIYGDAGDVTGWSWPLLAYLETDSLTGLSWTPFLFSASHVKGDMTGVTWGVFTWQEGQSTGLNLNVVNVTNNVKGLNWSVANVASGYTVADVGLVNVSKKSNFQLAAVNVTDELDGLQVGLLNCAKNGFLPCFIFFNFGQTE